MSQVKAMKVLLAYHFVVKKTQFWCLLGCSELCGTFQGICEEMTWQEIMCCFGIGSFRWVKKSDAQERPSWYLIGSSFLSNRIPNLFIWESKQTPLSSNKLAHAGATVKRTQDRDLMGARSGYVAARNNWQLFTDTEVNNCFSIYHTSWITSGPKSNLTCLRVTLF